MTEKQISLHPDDISTPRQTVLFSVKAAADQEKHEKLFICPFTSRPSAFMGSQIQGDRCQALM